MARIRNNPRPWAEKYDTNHRREYRSGGWEDELWDEDELVDHVHRSKKKGKKKYPGCPGNDDGPHIYVWVPWSMDWFFRDDTYEVKVCCGCEKRAGSKSFRRKVNND